MKKNFMKTAAACGLCLTLLATGASAAFTSSARNQMNARAAFGQMETMFGGQQNGQMNNQMNGQMGGSFGSPFGTQAGFGQMQNGMTQTASSAGTIVTGTTTNSAASLEADYANATTITMSESNSKVKIEEAGTYIVTGSCSDGSITVKKGTTGVVLVLKDLDLTSTTGATLSVNKGAEAKIIVSGSVKLTDAEDPADENSTDATVADAFDGAAIKVKAGANAYITGTGTLTVNGSAKNGVKISASDDDGNGSLVIDGATININATNDAINAEYDLAILSGTLTITAGDDALHADRVLTVGTDGSGPSITIKSCTEGVEATVVNLAGGTVNVTSTDDGVNAANSDGTYASLGYSINVTGAKLTVNAPRADGLDSNGNINLISGSATIKSASTGGDAGMDYDGQLYISDDFDLNNQSGVSNMGGGMMGGMNGQMGGQMNNQTGNAQGTAPTQNQQSTAPSQNSNQAPTQNQQGMNQMPTQGQQSMNQMPMQGQQGMNQMPTQNQQGMNQMPMQGQQGMNQMPMQGQQGMNQMPMQGQPGMGQMPMQGMGPMGGRMMGGMFR